MAFMFPWSNFHELNLDWILSVVKEAKDIFVRGEGDIQHAVETADQALETAEQAAAGVIADGSVTIPKVNDEVFNLLAYIVSGSVNAVAIPEGSLVILRKSTVYGANDGIYVAAANIPASSVLTAADLLQPAPLPDAGGMNYIASVLDSEIDDTVTSINAIERGLVIVVNGNDASSPVPVGGLAYLKNNENGLQEGVYANISNAQYPTTGGTADLNVFTAVSDVLNSLKYSINQTDQNISYLESGYAASRTYATGEFVNWQGSLYKTTAPIPSGTSFSVGSNLKQLSGGGLNNIMDATPGCCKFPDGTMFEWGNLTSGAISANSAKTVAITFPEPFLNSPEVFTNVETGAPNERMSAPNAGTSTGFDFVFYVVSATSNLYGMWFAVGRWR